MTIIEESSNLDGQSTYFPYAMSGDIEQLTAAGMGFEYKPSTDRDETVWKALGSPEIDYSTNYEYLHNPRYTDILENCWADSYISELHAQFVERYPWINGSFQTELYKAVSMLEKLRENRFYVPHIQELISMRRVFGIVPIHEIWTFIAYVRADTWLRQPQQWYANLWVTSLSLTATPNEVHRNNFGMIVKPHFSVPTARILRARQTTNEAFLRIYRLMTAGLFTRQVPQIVVSAKNEKVNLFCYKIEGVRIYLSARTDLERNNQAFIVANLLRTLSYRFDSRTKYRSHARVIPVEYTSALSDFLKKKAGNAVKDDPEVKGLMSKADALIERVMAWVPEQQYVKEFAMDPENVAEPIGQCLIHGVISPDNWAKHATAVLLGQIAKWHIGRHATFAVSMAWAVFSRHRFDTNITVDEHSYDPDEVKARLDEGACTEEEYTKFDKWKKKACDILEIFSSLIHGSIENIMTSMGIKDSEFLSGLMKHFIRLSRRALETATVAIIIKTISTVVGHMVSLMRRLFVKLTGIDTLKDVNTIALEIENWATDCHLAMEYDKTWIIAKICKNRDDIQKFEKFLEKTKSPMELNRFEPGTLHAYQCETGRLVREGDKLAVAGARAVRLYQSAGSDVVSMHATLNRTLNEIKQHHRTVSQMVQSMASTEECIPNVLVLTGTSGIGKSSLLAELAECIAYREGCNTPDEISQWVKQQLFPRPMDPEIKHTEGYNGHSIMVYDDALQFYTDEQKMDLFYKDLIHHVSPLANQTNQAALQNKGRQFSSKYIIATTNQTIIDATLAAGGTRDPQAIHNRIHCFVNVTLRPEFIVKNEGKKLVRNEQKINNLENSKTAFWFEFCNTHDGKPLKTINIGTQQINGGRKTFDEFMAIWFQFVALKEAYKERKRQTISQIGAFEKVSLLDINGKPLASTRATATVGSLSRDRHDAPDDQLVDNMLSQISGTKPVPASMNDNQTDLAELSDLGIETTGWEYDITKRVEQACVQITSSLILAKKSLREVEDESRTIQVLMDELTSSPDWPARLTKDILDSVTSTTAPRLMVNMWITPLCRTPNSVDNAMMHRYADLKYRHGAIAQRIDNINHEIGSLVSKELILLRMRDRDVLYSVSASPDHSVAETIKIKECSLEDDVKRAISLDPDFKIAWRRSADKWTFWLEPTDPYSRSHRYVHDSVLLPVMYAFEHGNDIVSSVKSRAILDISETQENSNPTSTAYDFPINKATLRPVIPLSDLKRVVRTYQSNAEDWVTPVTPGGVFSLLVGGPEVSPGQSIGQAWRQKFANADFLSATEVEGIQKLATTGDPYSGQTIHNKLICVDSSICKEENCGKWHCDHAFTARDLMAIKTNSGVRVTGNGIMFLYPHPTNNFTTIEATPANDELLRVIKSNDSTMVINLDRVIDPSIQRVNPNTAGCEKSWKTNACDMGWWAKSCMYKGYRDLASSSWTGRLLKVGGMLIAMLLAVKGMKSIWSLFFKNPEKSKTEDPAEDISEPDKDTELGEIVNKLPPIASKPVPVTDCSDNPLDAMRQRDFKDIVTKEELAPKNRTRPIDDYWPSDYAAKYLTVVANQTGCFVEPGKDRSIGVVTFISDRVAITARHVARLFCKHLREGRQYLIKTPFNNGGVPIDEDDFCVNVPYDAPGDIRDVVTIHFGFGPNGNAMPGFRSLINAPPDLSKSICYRIVTREKDGKLTNTIDAHDINYTGNAYGKQLASTTNALVINEGIPGDSGGVIIAYDRARWTIVGVFSGVSTKGCGGIVALASTDVLRAAIVRSPGKQQYEIQDPIIDNKPAGELTQRFVNEKPELNYRCLGIAASGPVVQQHSKMPSAIYGLVNTPTRDLSVLKPVVRKGEIVDPLKVGITKGMAKSAPHNAKVLACAVKGSIRKALNQVFDTDRARIKSIHDTIYGRLGDDSRKRVNPQASPGSGLRKLFVLKYNEPCSTNSDWMGKRDSNVDVLGEWLLTNNDPTPIDVDMEDQYYCTLIADYEREILKDFDAGIYRSVLVNDLPKSETRPLEKIDQVKTRIFSVFNDVRSQIFVKRLVGGAFEMLESRPVLSGSAVGLNVYSHSHVSQTVAYLTQKGYCCIVAGDFKNFDGSHPHRALDLICDELVEAFYPLNTPKVKELQKYVMRGIHSVVHKAGHLVWQSENSIPSGCLGTTTLNILLNDTAHRYCFLELAKQFSPTHATNDAFDKLVSPLYYGDDCIIAVDPIIQSWYNQQSLIDTMPKLGYTYTLESKTDGVVPLVRTLEECTFLKRHFRSYSNSGIVRMALAKESIENLPNFVGLGIPIGEATFDNATGALCEAAMWGEDYFQELRTRLIEALETQGLYGYYETKTNFGHSRRELPRTSFDVLLRIDRGQLPFEMRNYIVDNAVTEYEPLRYSNAWIAPLYSEYFKLVADPTKDKSTTAFKNIDFVVDPRETTFESINRFEHTVNGDIETESPVSDEDFHILAQLL